MKDTKSPPDPASMDNPYAMDPSGGSTQGKSNFMVPAGLHKQFSAIDEESEGSSDRRENSSDTESDDGSEGAGNTCVMTVQTKSKAFCSTYSSQITKVVIVLLLLAYTAYFAYAIHYSLELAEILIYITILVVICIVYVFIRDTFGATISAKVLDPAGAWLDKHWHWLQWFVYPGIVIGLVCYLSFGVVSEMKQLQSLSGIVVFISLSYLTSKYPDRIRWRPVVWGYALQFAMGVFVLRWEWGYRFVQFLGDEITKFINYAYDGAATVYGDPFMVFHPFAFMGLSMIIYMGAVMSMLYYMGITQILAGKMAWLMQKTMGTTAIETLGVASNIFLNGMDTMLMLRTYLDRLTKSEFHCFLVGGHSTIAGFVFGLFVLFGAPPQHLISGAVMSAPAVIAICKLNYPETRESITKRVEDVQLARGVETNIFEACANGASIAGKTVAAVLVNYIAFLGLLAWINATLAWIGERVGYDNLSFEEICSYLFWPLALIIGVDIKDCRNVAKLIGIKVFTTEILAYQELGVDYRNGLISDRSRTIATYALCGFSSLSTLAIAVGVWATLCPQRVPMVASMMLRALINANLSCFMTSCIAGLLYRDDLVIPEESYPLVGAVLGWLPSYKDLMALVGM